MESSDIVVYANKTCPYCTRATRLLDQKGVDYRLIDVSNDKSLWAEMEARSKRHTVPQIFIGEHHVGGCDDLYAADKRGDLDQLLMR
jgi:glutaredoxin 3